jgi:superfamily II DNA helicase RecQ
MTLEERRTVLATFSDASRGILLANSSLNHGYHPTNIRRTFSFSMPENLMQYSQESGRVGRDGKSAIARIILAPALPFMLQ